MKIIFLFIVLTCVGVVQAQTNHKRTLLLHGFLHVGNGESLPSAAIGIVDGKITLIKNSLAFTYNQADWDTIVDLKGRHVYPGFVAPNSTLGLTEIDAVRATRDFDETGRFNPHIRSQIAYNVESEVIATVRTNGVLITQATPRGGVISGTSSVMALDGWNWEDATLLKDDGIHVNWPRPYQRAKENRQVKEGSKEYDDQKAEIYSFFEAAKAYSEKNKPATLDGRYEALREVFKGKKRVYIHAEDIRQLNDALDFIKTFEIAYPVLVGARDSYLITRKLVDAKIPVMLYRTHSLPAHEEDPVYESYQVATRLQEAGVLFCIQNEGDMEAMNARNIPFLAGTCKAYGLTEEQAVAAISLNACKIMGIDKEFGSIEIGKSATLFISDGNALDMRSNNIYLAMIRGKWMSTNNHQRELYLKYKQKYEQH